MIRRRLIKILIERWGGHHRLRHLFATRGTRPAQQIAQDVHINAKIRILKQRVGRAIPVQVNAGLRGRLIADIDPV